VEAFVDSNGYVVNTEIRRSSGVDGIDEAAVSAVQFSTFRPATFLCTPVVSSQL
jgi:TonB family protein